MTLKQRVLAAAVDDDLAGFVIQAVLALELVRHRLPQLGRPAAGRVFGEPGRQRGHRGILDVLRRVEIRFARAETDDILALGLEGFGLGINGQGQGRGERGGALRNLVLHRVKRISPPPGSSKRKAAMAQGASRFLAIASRSGGQRGNVTGLSAGTSGPHGVVIPSSSRKGLMECGPAEERLDGHGHVPGVAGFVDFPAQSCARRYVEEAVRRALEHRRHVRGNRIRPSIAVIAGVITGQMAEVGDKCAVWRHRQEDVAQDLVRELDRIGPRVPSWT